VVIESLRVRPLANGCTLAPPCRIRVNAARSSSSGLLGHCCCANGNSFSTKTSMSVFSMFTPTHHKRSAAILLLAHCFMKLRGPKITFKCPRCKVHPYWLPCTCHPCQKLLTAALLTCSASSQANLCGYVMVHLRESQIIFSFCHRLCDKGGFQQKEIGHQ